MRTQAAIALGHWTAQQTIHDHDDWIGYIQIPPPYRATKPLMLTQRKAPQ